MDLQLKKKNNNPTMNHLVHFGIYSTACFSLNTFVFVPSMKHAVLYPCFWSVQPNNNWSRICDIPAPGVFHWPVVILFIPREKEL